MEDGNGVTHVRGKLLLNDLVCGDEFIGVKSFKARGKRLTTFEIDEIIELEPTKFPPPPEITEIPEGEMNEEENDEPEQLTLFNEE